jgi:hypothetical protein
VQKTSLLPPQAVPQVPWEQTWPAGQAFPQAPQLALSVAVVAQNDPPSPVHAV